MADGRVMDPDECRFSRILPSSALASSSGNRCESLFLRRLYKQKRRSRSRVRPATTPMTMPAMAPPDRLEDDDPDPEPAELVGEPERVLDAVATSVPVELGAAGSESVVNPEGRAALLAARMRPQLEGMSEDSATW